MCFSFDPEIFSEYSYATWGDHVMAPWWHKRKYHLLLHRPHSLTFGYHYYIKNHTVTYHYRVNTKLGLPLVKLGAGMTGFREVYIQFSKNTGIITITG